MTGGEAWKLFAHSRSSAWRARPRSAAVTSYRWVRAGSGRWLGLVGGLVLFLYGVLPTLQRAYFGRVYAACGGVLVVLALLWGWWVEGRSPDRWDVVGAVVVSIGVGITFFTPRTG